MGSLSPYDFDLPSRAPGCHNLPPGLSHVSLRLMVQKSGEFSHLGCCWNLVNNGINYQPQLVSRISSINSRGSWTFLKLNLHLCGMRWLGRIYPKDDHKSRMVKFRGWKTFVLKTPGRPDSKTASSSSGKMQRVTCATKHLQVAVKFGEVWAIRWEEKQIRCLLLPPPAQKRSLWKFQDWKMLLLFFFGCHEQLFWGEYKVQMFVVPLLL